MKQFIVETSARHVHVTQQDLETLFGKGYELTVKKMLSQPGQYASAERVDVVGPKKTLTGVSILGPVRSATQVELSLTDARSIGVTAPVRESGDIAGSGACKLVGPAGEVELTEGVIAAKRHTALLPKLVRIDRSCFVFNVPQRHGSPSRRLRRVRWNRLFGAISFFGNFFQKVSSVLAIGEVV